MCVIPLYYCLHIIPFIVMSSLYSVQQQKINTVFTLLDAAATIYFTRQFGAASIGERLLIESGV